MIQIEGVSKSFEELCAVKALSLEIRDGEVFGLVGTNGAGKSTLLRMLAGVLRPDQGKILAEGQEVFENPEIKAEIFYIPDEAFFFANARVKDMAEYYQAVYPGFDRKRFRELLDMIGMEENRRISTFSKGMKKQLSFLLGLCSGTKYLLCDETFDGLDPVMRQAVKSIIAGELSEREFTPVISSHNLRELEDFCDRVGLLHEGGMLFSRGLDDMKLHILKVQCVIPDAAKEEKLLRDLRVVNKSKQGSLLTITARGTREEIMAAVSLSKPVFSEVIPLSLEEIFICETEVAGYEIKNIFF